MDNFLFYFESEIPKREAVPSNMPNTPFVVVSGGGKLVTSQQNLSGSTLGKKLVEEIRDDAIIQMSLIGTCHFLEFIHFVMAKDWALHQCNMH